MENSKNYEYLANMVYDGGYIALSSKELVDWDVYIYSKVFKEVSLKYYYMMYNIIFKDSVYKNREPPYFHKSAEPVFSYDYLFTINWGSPFCEYLGMVLQRLAQV